MLFMLTFINGNGQEIEHNENGTWFTVINKFKFSEKLAAVNILQWRLVKTCSYTRVFIVEPRLDYKFSKCITAGLGYNHSNYNLAGIRPPTLDYENRFNQHITLFSTLGKLKMNQRFMFEERFITKNNGNELYANRFRYRMCLDFNLFRFSNDKYLQGRVSDEIRIRFTEGVSDPIFGQNNFLAAIGYPLLKNAKLLMGYGRNYYNGGTLGYWGDHIFNIAYSYNFDFTKKQFDK